MSQPLLPSPAEEAAQPQGNSFWDHLGELRRRLMYIAWCLLLGFIAAWAFREQLFQLATAPIYNALAPYGIYRLMAIHTGEAMLVYVKLCFVADMMLVLPFSIYQLWAFVRPGLLAHEIRPIRRVVVLAMFFFVLGVLFCYRVVLPFLIDFMASFTVGSGDIDFQLTMDSAYSTTLNSMLMFGVIFELPLAMVMLTAMPFLTWRTYVKFARYAVVLSFVVGAILTPPDVVSQILMSVPLVGLYGVGIFLSWMLERARAKGKPVSGVDWGLLVTVLVMCAVIAPFVWPKTPDATAALPTGVHAAVTLRGPQVSPPRCPSIPQVPPEAGPVQLWVCARYLEGSLAVLQVAPEQQAQPICDALPTTPDIDQVCLALERTAVIGPAFLVAAYRSRAELGDSVASPLSQFTGDGTLLYVRPNLPAADSNPHLLAFFPAAVDLPASLSLSAASVSEAKGLTAQIEDKQPAPAQAPSADRVGDTNRLALLKLTQAVELVADQNPALKSQLAVTLQEVKTLLDASPVLGPTSVLACESVACCLGALLPHLNAVDDLEVQGRQMAFVAATPTAEQLATLTTLLLK